MLVGQIKGRHHGLECGGHVHPSFAIDCSQVYANPTVFTGWGREMEEGEGRSRLQLDSPILKMGEFAAYVWHPKSGVFCIRGASPLTSS